MQSPNLPFRFPSIIQALSPFGEKESPGARDTAAFREETQDTTDSAAGLSSLFLSPQTHLGWQAWFYCCFVESHPRGLTISL